MSELKQEGARPGTAFLTTGVTVVYESAKYNTVDFTSREVGVPRRLGTAPTGALTFTFTRTTGTNSPIYFEFQVSYNGTIWASKPYLIIPTKTNEIAVSTVVHATYNIHLEGVQRIRLYGIRNTAKGSGGLFNGPDNNCSACNAFVSF